MIDTFAQVIAAADPSSWQQCVEDQSWWDGFFSPNACVDSVSDLAADVIGKEVVQPYIDDAKNGVSTSIKTMVSFWISVPDPNLGGTDGSVSDPISFLHGGLAPLVAIIMAFSVLAACIVIVWTNRTDPARRIAQMLLTFIIVEGAAVGAVAVGLELISVTSTWLIEQSTSGTSFSDNLFSLFDTTEGVGSAIILIALLLAAAAISAFTSVLMLARAGILLALMGARSLSVAMSATEGGFAAMRHYFGWIAAFGLYKLAGAIVYCVGFRLLGTDTDTTGNGFLQILQGLTVLGMAVLALPACIRLIVPAVSPVANGRGAGAAVVGAGAAAATSLVRR
jgi:hypothetical protein